MRTRNTDKVELVKQKAIELLVSKGFEGFSMNKLAVACNISVATLYIYYKDKDDLIIKIAIEEGKRMNDITLKDFDPNASFAVGLRKQWENRAKYVLENGHAALFFEQLRSSSYHEKVIQSIMGSFKDMMKTFMKNAEERGEINKMPLEVYWSVAFSPLYALLRFHNEGASIGGKSFNLTDKVLWQTFDLVLKALKK